MFHMMTSSNGNIFRVTGHLCGKLTGDKDQWRGALMFSLICAWINGWENNRAAGDLRRHRAHYDIIVTRYYDRHTAVLCITANVSPCNFIITVTTVTTVTTCSSYSPKESAEKPFPFQYKNRLCMYRNFHCLYNLNPNTGTACLYRNGPLMMKSKPVAAILSKYMCKPRDKVRTLTACSGW